MPTHDQPTHTPHHGTTPSAATRRAPRAQPVPPWTITGQVIEVTGTEADTLRTQLTAAVADLLAWTATITPPTERAKGRHHRHDHHHRYDHHRATTSRASGRPESR